jgi:hypothetical protein
MGNLNINNAVLGDNKNQVAQYEISALNVETPQDLEETEYTIKRANEYWSWFNVHPDLQSAFVMKGIWDTGKGYTADAETMVILDHINGNGKQTFKDILFSMDISTNLFGESYAEIIRDEDTGELINLKLLNPANIKTIYGKRGDIIRYEQFNAHAKNTVTTWKPEDIFVLSNMGGICGKMGGISKIEAMENTLKADMESFDDVRKVMHSQAIPLILWKLKTDDPTTIGNFVNKINTARKLGGENVFIPDDDNIVTHELVEVNLSSAIFEWRNDIRNKFYRVLGMPQIVFGSSQSTESGGKVEMMAHENVFEFGQSYIEEQVWNQLYLKINLISPTSILSDLQTDQAKDSGQMGMNQTEMKPGVGE